MIDRKVIGRKFFMAIISPSLDLRPVFACFIAPILALLPDCRHRRECSELDDATWITLGLQRVLSTSASGRAFLQSHPDQPLDPATSTPLPPRNGHYFEALKSPRRLALCTELNARLLRSDSARALPDRLAAFPCLNDFEIFATDGHWHDAATHDTQRLSSGAKAPTGHLYTRNLRSGLIAQLQCLDQSPKKHEHEIKALKRTSIDELRQGAPVGRKVLHVYDRACIDFGQWYKWKQGSGIYVLSRTKENMTLETCGELPFDQADPVNAGVLADQLVHGSYGAVMRRIRYHDPIMGNDYEFLTSLLDRAIPPGVLAYLYFLRWSIEKVFDELKNKLGETKAWATSGTAKTMQAQFICLVFNLLQIMESKLREEGVSNTAEEKRQDERAARIKAGVEEKGLVYPVTHEMGHSTTQHSVKFIRWLNTHLHRSTPWLAACALLSTLYAKL